MEATGGGRGVMWLAGWTFVAGAGLLMTSQAAGWSGTRSIAVVQSLTPYVIVALAPIALGATLFGRPRLGFVAALVGVGGLVLALPVVFPAVRPAAADGAAGVSVASVNLLYSNGTVVAAADALVDQQADVIVFSEYTPEHRAALVAHRLADGYPFKIEREGQQAGGLAVWSRYPVREVGRLPTVNFSVDAEVDGPDGRFELVGVHPPAPVFDFDAWRHDLRVVRDRAYAATGPTLLVGDFNASYWHPMFRDLLDAGFADAHIALGHGFSTSWPAGDWRPRFVRLDHALTGRGLVAVEVADFDVPGSDHRGFAVTVAPVRRAG